MVCPMIFGVRRPPRGELLGHAPSDLASRSVGRDGIGGHQLSADEGGIGSVVHAHYPLSVDQPEIVVNLGQLTRAAGGGQIKDADALSCGGGRGVSHSHS